MVRHLGLAVHLAQQFGYRQEELLDVIQHAAIGLMTAVEKYDPERGYTFSTYARWWIKATIQRGRQNTGAIIRKTSHQLTLEHRIKRQWAEFEQHHDRPPSFDELVSATSLSRRQLTEVIEHLHLDTVSYEEITAETDGRRGRQFTDRRFLSPELTYLGQMAYHEQRHQLIELKQLAILTNRPRDATMWVMYHGDGRCSITLKTVAQRYGIKRSRAQQVIIGVWSRLYAHGVTPELNSRELIIRRHRLSELAELLDIEHHDPFVGD